MQRNSHRLGIAGLSCLALLLVSLVAAPAHALTSTFNILITEPQFGTQQGDFTVWLPDDIGTRQRGLIFYIPGSSGNSQGAATSTYFQDAARSMGFGFMGVGVHNNAAPFLGFAADPTAMQRALDAAATATGHPELSNVPFATFGDSAGGSRSVFIAKFNPTRAIAAVAQVAGAADPGSWMTSASSVVPTLTVSGSIDTSGHPSLGQSGHEWWRTNLNAQSAFAADWGSPHDTTVNQSMDATLFWISEAARLRYPAALPSTTPGNPLALKTLNVADGYFAQGPKFTNGGVGIVDIPTYTSPFTPFSSAASYTGDPNTASWLPSLDAAFMYRAMTSVDNVSKVATRSLTPRQGELRLIAANGEVLGYNPAGP
jgi:hypothetical protein